MVTETDDTLPSASEDDPLQTSATVQPEPAGDSEPASASEPPVYVNPDEAPDRAMIHEGGCYVVGSDGIRRLVGDENKET